MRGLLEYLDGIIREPNTQMVWGRIPHGHIIGERRPEPFETNNDYVVVRLASMFLRDSRRLWLKLSPLTHASVSLQGLSEQKSETAVIGPAQFGELATASAERNVILNQRLSGPSVWRGGDLDVAAGLFAVPKDQAAGALLDTLAQLAGLGIPGLEDGEEIARIVKGGVESLIGLDGTKPVLGVKVALTDAVPGVLAGIAAPASEVDFSQLWIQEGRLRIGSAAEALSPFEEHDHLLLTIEKGPPRQDWRGLPDLLPFESTFKQTLSSIELSIAEKKSQISDEFRAFSLALDDEEALTDADQDRIRGEVKAYILRWIRILEDPLFAETEERRSASASEGKRAINPRGFDFLEVGSDGLEGARPEGRGAELL